MSDGGEHWSVYMRDDMCAVGASTGRHSAGLLEAVGEEEAQRGIVGLLEHVQGCGLYRMCHMYRVYRFWPSHIVALSQLSFGLCCSVGVKSRRMLEPPDAVIIPIYLIRKVRRVRSANNVTR